MLLGTDAHLTFRRIFLVAPYVLPTVAKNSECLEWLVVHLRAMHGNLWITNGSADYYYNTRSRETDMILTAVHDTCQHKVFDRTDHDELKKLSVQHHGADFVSVQYGQVGLRNGIV